MATASGVATSWSVDRSVGAQSLLAAAQTDLELADRLAGVLQREPRGPGRADTVRGHHLVRVADRHVGEAQGGAQRVDHSGQATRVAGGEGFSEPTRHARRVSPVAVHPAVDLALEPREQGRQGDGDQHRREGRPPERLGHEAVEQGNDCHVGGECGDREQQPRERRGRRPTGCRAAGGG